MMSGVRQGLYITAFQGLIYPGFRSQAQMWEAKNPSSALHNYPYKSYAELHGTDLAPAWSRTKSLSPHGFWRCHPEWSFWVRMRGK